MKKDQTLWLIAIILIGTLFYISQIPEETGMVLTPHYYKDGVEVFPSKGLFSLVTPPGESFDQIAFDILVTNLDIPIENIQIVEASPLVFNSSLPTTIHSLAVGESKTLWTSGLMNTSDFEPISPVNFWINISGYDTFNREIIYKEVSVSLTIEAESQTATQSFFSELFSIVDFGGQTYHHDVGDEAPHIEYLGSGYLTGIYVYSGTCYSSYPNTLTVYLDDILFFNGQDRYDGIGCGFHISTIARFENSLKIDYNIGYSAYPDYEIDYITD